MGGGGCESIASCTLPNWLDSRLAFSPDGKFFAFVAQGFGTSFMYVWSSDGMLIKSDQTKLTTMSTWSAQSLYFRDGGGVEAWHDGAISRFLADVGWIKPSASPAGGKVVYTVRGAGGWGHIYLVETGTGKARELKAQRTDAVFLTSRYVWYRGERACVAADGCGPNPPFHPESGMTYIYDLQTGTEFGSIITGVYDVWPHAA
jgi:dipeptidyl aminopeptidase/acylaminoacyl peptidase